jgi:hypothetical protein
MAVLLHNNPVITQTGIKLKMVFFVKYIPAKDNAKKQ